MCMMALPYVYEESQKLRPIKEGYLLNLMTLLKKKSILTNDQNYGSSLYNMNAK